MDSGTMVSRDLEPQGSEGSGTDAERVGNPDGQDSEPRDVEASEQGARSLAQAHDSRVREIERQITGAWSELAELAIQVRNGQEWAVLGFRSFNAWLVDAAPRSRAMIYSAIGLLEELKDVPIEDLRQIGIGNAHILKKLPHTSRTSRGVLEAAKALPPRQMLATVIETHPAEHLEQVCTQRFKFTVSQWQVIEAAIDEMMSQYDGAITTREEALEAIAADWMQSQ